MTTPTAQMPMNPWTGFRTLRDRAFETGWQVGSRTHRIDPVRLTWKVEPERLAEIVVRWPATYEWAPRRIWGAQVLAALRRYVRCEIHDIPQPYRGVINFDVVIAGRRHAVGLETSDYPDLNEDAYQAADLYFKQEYQLGGYGDRERLLPGGYVNADAVIYRYLHRLRRLRDKAPTRYEVHGRYGLSLEKRRRPLEILRSSSAFTFFGGEGKVRYSRFLSEIAQARVCIDLPSMSSITFRMMDYCAIGSCIVGPPHTNQLTMPFQDGVHVAYCRPDYSDLEERCVYYLEHEDERRQLIANSRAFFDAYLHRDQVGSYLLHECLRFLN